MPANSRWDLIRGLKGYITTNINLVSSFMPSVFTFEVVPNQSGIFIFRFKLLQVSNVTFLNKGSTIKYHFTAIFYSTFVI